VVANQGSPSDFLARLVGAVTRSIVTERGNPLGPLAVDYARLHHGWTVAMAPTAVRVVDGVMQGAVIAPSFVVDQLALQGIFDRVDSFHVEGDCDGSMPSVKLNGRFRGQQVELTLCLGYDPFLPPARI
jgi:hypothetical protein